jgi:hypothetical protein
VIELLAIGQQVEDKHFHGAVPVNLGQFERLRW